MLLFSFFFSPHDMHNMHPSLQAEGRMIYLKIRNQYSYPAVLCIREAQVCIQLHELLLQIETSADS